MNAALRELLRHPDGAEFQVAETYAYLGDTDKAFEFLNRALTTDPGIIWLPHDPFCASLVADARYKVILKRMNLPVSQKAKSAGHRRRDILSAWPKCASCRSSRR